MSDRLEDLMRIETEAIHIKQHSSSLRFGPAEVSELHSRSVCAVHSLRAQAR